MKTLSLRDVEKLSAYLDGQLSRADSARLDIRLQAEPDLAAALDDLRTARSLLRRTPKRRAPRNFSLTPKMAGLRPPLPRAVPTLSWASAAAMLLFVCTLGTNLLGKFSFGAAAPQLAAAPANASGASDRAYGIGGGPAATEPPASMESLPLGTPTPEILTMPVAQATAVPDGTSEATGRNNQPLAESNNPTPVNIWLWIWPGLAFLLLVSALLIRWTSLQSFRKRNKK